MPCLLTSTDALLKPAASIDVADLMTEAQLSLKRRDTSTKLRITAQNIVVVLQLMLLRGSIRYLL
jgi:hypothetical protein